jgi:methanethiol S-methyltransferase
MLETGFFWMILAVGMFGTIHSWLASMTMKRYIARLCKQNFERFYRLLYSLISAITLLQVLALVVLLPDRTLYHIPVPWIGLTLLIQAGALWGMAVSMGRSGTGRFLGIDQALGWNTAEKKDELLVDGLYHWVRHPIYMFSLIFIWLIPWMSINVLGLNIGMTCYLGMGTLLEERKLEAVFGEAYMRYKRSTPMFFPLRLRKRK